MLDIFLGIWMISVFFEFNIILFSSIEIHFIGIVLRELEHYHALNPAQIGARKIVDKIKKRATKL